MSASPENIPYIFTDADRREAYFQAVYDGVYGTSSLPIYLDNLGIDALPDGLVLELGGGPDIAFQWQAAYAFPDTKLVSLEPYLTLEPESTHYYPHSFESRMMLYSQDQYDRMRNHAPLALAGIAQQLPFRSDVFDMTLAHASVPVYLPLTPDTNEPNVHYMATFAEAQRVTKPAGEIIFSPMHEAAATESVKALAALMVQESDYELKAYPVPAYAIGNNPYQEWYRLKLTKPRV